MSRTLCRPARLRDLALAVALSVFCQPALAQETSEIEALDEALRPYVMPPSGPFRPDQVQISQSAAIAAWARSGHADSSSRSFTNWDAAGEMPGVCATCHSGEGFRALYGLDGSTPGIPDHPMPTGGVVDCQTCHNPGLSEVTEVRLPSGMMHPVSPGEASCLTCHQGRAAGTSVAEATSGQDEDSPNPDLSFINPHYAVAAATWLGGYGALGYHYPGKSYSGRFFHARPVETCVSCHEPHSLEVQAETCLTCHQQGAPGDIRLSRISHDGSGDLSKGIRADIEANAARLKAMLHDYAARVGGVAMVYDAHRHPYFYRDADGDGRPDQADGRPLPYDSWTPRMLKAAYNWKFVTADAGAFAHNPHYALELLYDSIEALSEPLGVDLAATGLQR